MAFNCLIGKVTWKQESESIIMGLVKTRRLAAMQKQTTYAKVTVVRQRAKAGMKSPVKKGGDMLSANRRDNGYGL